MIQLFKMPVCGGKKQSNNNLRVNGNFPPQMDCDRLPGGIKYMVTYAKISTIFHTDLV